MIKKLLISICVILIFVYLGINFFRPITAINEDLGLHVLLGKIIVQAWQVPHINLLSYTYPAYPFINSHWLSEVLYYLLYKNFTFNSLIILTTAIILTSVASTFLFLYKRYTVSSILPLYLLVSMVNERSDVRPEVFSYFFFSLFIIILYAHREHYTRWIFFLPLLELLWINMHIYFFIGILTILLFLFEELVISHFKLTRPVKTLSLVFFAAVAVALINPDGVKGLLLPLTVQQNYGTPVFENQNLWFFIKYFNPSVTLIFYFIVMFFIVLFSLFLTIRKARLIDLLMVFVFAIATIMVSRTAPLFAFAAIVPLTSALFHLKPLNFLEKYTGAKNAFILKRYSLLVFCILLIGQIGKTLLIQPAGLGINDLGKSATDFLINNKVQGPLYNNFDIGGYLSYRLYPTKVFIDNRPEAYPKEFTKQVSDSESEPMIFNMFDKKFNFNAVILRHWNMYPFKNPLFSNLLTNEKYRLIYLDDYTVIFVKNTGINEELIQKYGLSEEKFSLKPTLDQDVLIRYIYVFEKAGWEKKEKEAYTNLLKLDPGACKLLSYLSQPKKLYISTGLSNIERNATCAL